MGEGGWPKVYKGEEEGFRIVYVHIFQDVFLLKLLNTYDKKCANICEK